jgi:hypothetical protein
MWRPLLLLSLAAVFATAQTANRAMTVTASRTVVLIADEVLFQVAVTASADLAEEQIYEALAPAGITARDLVGSSSSGLRIGGPQASTLVAYRCEFESMQPAERLNDTFDRLEALRVALPRGFLNLTYAMSAQASARQAEEARQRLLPVLVDDARRHAAALARAAGVELGPLPTVSDAGSAFPGVRTFALHGGGFISLMPPSTIPSATRSPRSSLSADARGRHPGAEPRGVRAGATMMAYAKLLCVIPVTVREWIVGAGGGPGRYRLRVPDRHAGGG